MSFAQLPLPEITVAKVLDIIARTERRHRVVWTAGRILMEDGSLHQVMTTDPGRRQKVLRRIRGILKNLLAQGLLAERGIQFNYGTNNKVSYDFVGHSDSPAADRS